MTIRPYRPEDKAAILEIQSRQWKGWFEKDAPPDVLADLDHPSHIQTMILEDDNGKIVAAVGARSTVEIAMTLDMDAWPGSLGSLFDNLRSLWAREIVELHKRGHVDCFARVGPHIKKWANTLLKRAGFQDLKTNWLSFSIQAACKDKRNET